MASPGYYWPSSSVGWTENTPHPTVFSTSLSSYLYFGAHYLEFLRKHPLPEEMDDQGVLEKLLQHPLLLHSEVAEGGRECLVGSQLEAAPK